MRSSQTHDSASYDDLIFNGREDLRKGNFVEAEAAFTKAKDKEPTNAEPYQLCARAYERLKKLREAKIDFRTAIELDPGNATLYAERGRFYHQLGKIDKAITDYTKAITQDPHNAVYYIKRAHLYQKLGENRKALADYTKAITQDRQNPVYYIERARFYQKFKEFSKARADFDKAIALDPHNATGYIERARFYQKFNENQKACADFNTAIKLEPNQPAWYMELGCLYRINIIRDKEYNLQPAFFNLDKAKELQPSLRDDARWNLEYGLIYYVINDFDNAIAYLSRSIMLEPTCIKAYFKRGKCFLQTDQLEKARADFSIIIALDPAHTEAYFERGMCFLMTGQLDEARADFDTVIRLNPKFKNIYSGYAGVFLKDDQTNLCNKIYYLVKAINAGDFTFQEHLIVLLRQYSKAHLLKEIRELEPAQQIFLLKEVVNETSVLGQKFRTTEGMIEGATQCSLTRGSLGEALSLLIRLENQTPEMREKVKVRRIARLLAQGTYPKDKSDKNPFKFFSLPCEVGALIASMTADETMLPPATAYQVARGNFARPPVPEKNNQEKSTRFSLPRRKK